MEVVSIPYSSGKVFLPGYGTFHTLTSISRLNPLFIREGVSTHKIRVLGMMYVLCLNPLFIREGISTWMNYFG
ncbi:hypothetical protein ACFL6I_08555 [candidate division KSB1 bacterium]